MHSTRYTIIFIVVLTSIAALLLSSMSTGLKSVHDRNEALFNKRAILSAVENQLDKEVPSLSDEEVEQIFTTQIEQLELNMSGAEVEGQMLLDRGYKGQKAEHIDMAKEKKRDEADRILPLFIFEKGGDKTYIVSVRGNGLWDEIWGNIAIGDDFNTVTGASFDHKG
ncbi:MAG: NADH:ubiquinone reductase (Na(+)-transporting) subunit C, partial [Eudoraea sp.]|nr:NADH:ubiquinone reductase (Na(+)-transporting) subunit C [Eudoraea sp.]